MPNRLANETSPYLLQHAHNPVDWYPWGPEALERAKREDKPIFLSIGYAACHWCHVMERESFEDAATAEDLNRDFVAIKVDREERPDLDQVYMAAVQAMTGQGGWPMSVFLTPDGQPFYGGTYFPPRAAHGMPAFRQVLAGRRAGVARATASRSSRRHAARRGPRPSRRRAGHRTALARPDRASSSTRPRPRSSASSTRATAAGAPRPKFPQPMTIEFLLRRAATTGDQRPLGDRPAQPRRDGRRRDPRPARRRLPPLRDRRDLARPALRADALRQRPARPRLRPRLAARPAIARYRRRRDRDARLHAPRAAPRRRHVRREPGRRHRGRGGRDVRLDRGRGPRGARRRRAGVHRRVRRHRRRQLGGHGRSCRASIPPSDDPDAEARLAASRATTPRAPRPARPQPARDDKALAAWNGLAIGGARRWSRWLPASRRYRRRPRSRAAEAILAGLRRPDGRLGRSWKDGRATGEGVLEDYADLADGLLALYEATFDERWFVAARELADAILEHFADPDRRLLRHGRRPRDARHPAEGPPGQRGAVGRLDGRRSVLLRLAALTGEARYREAADERAIATVTPYLGRYPTGFANWLSAAHLAVEGIDELAIVGDPADRRPRAAARGRCLRPGFRPEPRRGRRGRPGRSAVPLLAGRARIDGRPTAYLCRELRLPPAGHRPGRARGPSSTAGAASADPVDRRSRFATRARRRPRRPSGSCVAAYRTNSAATPTLATRRAAATLPAGARSCPVLVAADGDRARLGTVTYVPGPDNAVCRRRARRRGRLPDAGRAPSAMGRGIGRALANACVERARAAGPGGHRDRTRPMATAAHALYHSTGFARDPERDWEFEPGEWLWAVGPAVRRTQCLSRVRGTRPMPTSRSTSGTSRTRATAMAASGTEGRGGLRSALGEGPSRLERRDPNDPGRRRCRGQHRRWEHRGAGRSRLLARQAVLGPRDCDEERWRDPARGPGPAAHAHVARHNVASRRVLAKCGFVEPAETTRSSCFARTPATMGGRRPNSTPNGQSHRRAQAGGDGRPAAAGPGRAGGPPDPTAGVDGVRRRHLRVPGRSGGRGRRRSAGLRSVLIPDAAASMGGASSPAFAVRRGDPRAVRGGGRPAGGARDGRAPDAAASPARAGRCSAARRRSPAIAEALGAAAPDGPARPDRPLDDAADHAPPLRHAVLRRRAARRRRAELRGRRRSSPPLADAHGRARGDGRRARSRCGCRRARRSSSWSTPRDLAEIRARIVPGRVAAPRVIEERPGLTRIVVGSAGAVPGQTVNAYLVGQRRARSSSTRATRRTRRPTRSSTPHRRRAARIVAIALTHADPDHAAGAEALALRLELPILAGPGAQRGSAVPRPRARRRRADRRRRRRSSRSSRRRARARTTWRSRSMRPWRRERPRRRPRRRRGRRRRSWARRTSAAWAASLERIRRAAPRPAAIRATASRVERAAQ